jgi:hypothetical protein
MWQTELVEILRMMIGDWDRDNLTMTDENLVRVIIVAAFQVACTVSFTQDFTIDISEQTISPDPTAVATRDDSFCNLICLKAACILDNANAITAATTSLAGKDGFSSFDMRGVAEARIKLLQVGFCKQFEDEKADYNLGSNSVAGAVIMGPFRTAAGYSTIDGYYSYQNSYNKGY